LIGTQDIVSFEAVFVTAFEKKFLHTIRFSEVEIILKPIDRESLMAAIQIIAARIQAGASKDRYKVLLNNFSKGRNTSIDMVLPQPEGDDVTISLSEIAYLEALGDKTLFYLDDHRQMQAARPFRYYADLFGSLRFYQVNNLQMIPMNKINYVENESGKVVLKNGVTIEIAERRKKDLLLHMKQLK
jgi:two-component system LytT family response regulator